MNSMIRPPTDFASHEANSELRYVEVTTISPDPTGGDNFPEPYQPVLVKRLIYSAYTPASTGALTTPNTDVRVYTRKSGQKHGWRGNDIVVNFDIDGGLTPNADASFDEATDTLTIKAKNTHVLWSEVITALSSVLNRAFVLAADDTTAEVGAFGAVTGTLHSGTDGSYGASGSEFGIGDHALASRVQVGQRLWVVWKATAQRWEPVELNPLHQQLAVIVELTAFLGPTSGYDGTADTTFDLSGFAIVWVLLLDVGNVIDPDWADIPVYNPDSLAIDDLKFLVYDVRKEGQPRVGDVVRIWTSDGKHAKPGDGISIVDGKIEAPDHFVYCDVLNPGDYLRGLTTFNASNYQALVHEDGVADLRWVDLVDLGTEGGWSGGGGSGTVTSVTEGFAIDIAGTATDPVVHFDPTELGSYLTTDFQVYAHEPTSDGGPNPKWWTISGYVEANKQTILQSGGALSFEDAHKVRSTVNDTTAAFLHDAFKDKVAAGTYVSGKDYIIKFETDGASGTDQTERGFIDASAITNYNASAAQVLGHDATGAPYWYTIGPCA